MPKIKTLLRRTSKMSHAALMNNTTPCQSSALDSGDLFGVASNAIRAWDELTDTTHPRAFQRMKEAMKKLRDAVEDHQADEAGRVVDAMTPEQVDAYLVSMGVNLDEMRAHTAEMRKKLEARLSSPNTGDEPTAPRATEKL